MLVSYSVRDQEPILVEALKMKAFPEGSHGSRCGMRQWKIIWIYMNPC